MADGMDLSFKVLKEHFSCSRKRNSNYNPALLVTFAEHAAKSGCKDIAADCLHIYFGLSPPTNQFYIRAHLCEALITAPINSANQAGLVQALSSILKAVNIAKKSECYHFLVYNASVLLWQICRPYQYPGARHIFAKPLHSIVRALDECKEQDYEWRLQLLMGLIHSQIEAGCKDDAAQSCASAIQLARKKIPSRLINVLNVQIYYNLGEVKKDAEVSSEFSAICQLYKIKGIIHQQNLSGLELEQKLRKLFVFIIGFGESPATPSVPRDAQMPLLLVLATLCVENGLPGLAKEVIQADCAAKISHDPKLLLLRETLACQLSLENIDQDEEPYNRNCVEDRLRIISKIANLLAVAKRTQHLDLIQYICVVLWNVSFPLLQQNLRKQILKPLSDVASALEEIASVLFQLRANLHFEIAKIFVDQKHLQTGMKHLEQSFTLDILGEHSEQLRFLKKQLVLSAQLYDIPDNPFDQAARLVKQASAFSSVEELRPLLVKAGELLIPTYFTSTLRKISVQGNKLEKLRDYIQYKQQVQDFMTIVGNVKDKERCWILADIAKVARRHCVWDVTSVAAQMCLYYDDGRWKVIQKQESRANTCVSEHPSFQYGVPSKQVTISSVESSLASESKSGGVDQDLASKRKKENEIIMLLAEIHCILAECLINDLQSEEIQRPDNPSSKGCQEILIEWASAVTNDAVNSFVHAAELSSSVGESWLVYNAAASLWNYSHRWLEIDKVSASRRLLPILKQVDLKSDPVLGILFCTALSGGLVKKWMPAKPASEKTVSNVPMSGKKSGRQAIKKGRELANGEQLQVDPGGGQELKEALEVCEYAMTTYSEVSLDIYQKLLVEWVQCKQLMQQPIPAKTFGIAEGKDRLNCRAVVAIEMLNLMGNGVWDFPNCPTPYDVVSLLTECQWRDSLLEMSLWTKLGGILLKEKDYTLVHLCCDNVSKIHKEHYVESEKQESTLLLCLANSLRGQCQSATSSGNIATIRKALETFFNSARFACNAGSFILVMESCCHYWNTCLPLAAISVERDLLREPLLELLTLTASFVQKRKESVVKRVGNVSSFDHNVLIAMYGIVCQAYTDKCDWKGGLQAVEDAIWVMPKAISRHLYKHKLIFKSRMGRNVEGDMLKFQDEPNHLVASLWYQAARNASDQIGGLRAYKNAIQLLQSCNQSWLKVEYLIEFSEWLLRQQFPAQDVIDHLQEVVDILLSSDFSKDDAVQNPHQGLPSHSCNILNIHQLEALMRVHVMMSLLYIKGSDGHKKFSLAALGFCLQMWKVTYLTMNDDVKGNGPTLPTTIVEWASFQIPEQLIDNMKKESGFSSINECSIQKPMLSVHYLGVLVRSLTEIGIDVLAIPVLHMQLAIAYSSVTHSKPLCRLIYMRLIALCREVGLTSAAAAHSEKVSDVVLDPEDVARSLVEIKQHRAKKEATTKLGSKYGIQTMPPDKTSQETHTHVINVINDGVVLREIWVQQALVLISQGECQDAYELLNQALESCQIFEDNVTLFQVFSALSVLTLTENDRHKFIVLFMEAQELTCGFDHWLDGILLLTKNLTTSTGQDDVHQLSGILEYAVSFISSLKEKLKSNVTLEYGSAVLTSRLHLFKEKMSLTCSSGMLCQTPLLQNSELVTEAANSLLKQGCYRDAAHVFSEQANFYCAMAKQNYPLDLEKRHTYFLKALKLYEESINLLYDLYDSARILCQSSEDICLPIQRELMCAILVSTDTLLVTFKEYSDVVMLAQIKFQKKSSTEKVIDEFVSEVPELSSIDEDWKATATFAVEKTLGLLASAHFLAQGNSSLKAKCTFHVGHSFYLLARHNSPDWGLQWREQEVIAVETNEKKVKLEASTDDVKIDEATGTYRNDELHPFDDDLNASTTVIAKIGKYHDKSKVTEKISLQLLLQACHSLTEALYMLLSSCDWTTGAFAALEVMNCCGIFDPVISSLYLAFYQSLVTSMKMNELLRKAHSGSSSTQLGALLRQTYNLCGQKSWSTSQANSSQLKTYEVYRRLQISENHLELLNNFPTNFRYVILQHSLDRSQLFTAYLTPPQSALPVPKKGQSLQQAESLEPGISLSEVSLKDFNFLQEMLKDYHVSMVPLAGNSRDSMDRRSNNEFAVLLSAMEQYFADALKTIANSLSKESSERDLTVVILSDSDILQLPLEAMAVFQQCNIVSVSRDFSLQLLHHRILVFNNGDEEASTIKDKKKVDKHQVQPSTVLGDVNNFKYIFDPRNLCGESRSAMESLVNYISCDKTTSKWSGYFSPEIKVRTIKHYSLSEWCVLLKSASGLLYFGDERILACFPASQLTTMNLQKCHVVLLTDCKQDSSRVQHSRNYTLCNRKSESHFQEPMLSIMLLSLAGAGCVVTNQAFSSVISTSVIQDLISEGNTIGGINWTRTKTEQTQKVESSICDNEFNNIDAETPPLIKDTDLDDNKKQSMATTYDTIVYGLPHITLV